MIAIQPMADDLREVIEGFAAHCDPDIPPGVAKALRAFFAAKDDADAALMRSHLDDALKAFAEAVNDAVGKRLGWPERARAYCQRIQNALTNLPLENVDGVGKEIESRLDRTIQTLIELRDGPVKLLTERGYAIPNAAQLERDIAELQLLKKNVLDTWPWSTNELPPVDWEMADVSMAALAGGEKGQPPLELTPSRG